MLLRDVLSEDAGVVTESVDGSGAARRAVLAQTRRSLGHVAGEVDAGDRDALPVRRLRGHPAVVHHCHAYARQVAYRRAETRRRDDLVALQLELPLPCRPARMDAVAVRVALHALDRRVEDIAPAAAADVLGIRREVPDAERREGEHCGVHRTWRAEHDAARPRQQTLCELEPRV